MKFSIDTSVLINRNNEVKSQMQNILKNFSCNKVNINSTSFLNENYCSIILEAFFDTGQENKYGLVLSIDFNKKDDYVDSDFSIYKESGEFILSPKVFIIPDGQITDEFMNLLNEYYNVFELLIKNFILSEDDFITSYENVW